MSPRALWMIGFGAFLVAAGVLGWAAAGFTVKAKTALLSGAVCGSLMFACAWLLARQRAWLSAIGSIGGTILPLLFSGVFVWRATIAWSAWSGGEPKFFVALLLSVMAAAGVLTFAALYQRRGKSRPASGTSEKRATLARP
ncbi:MAG: hypothetical protein MJE77_15460 [Proteobacteria bacterium]|nr:hypothetical protein [Pseudomonadota bacterium]